MKNPNFKRKKSPSIHLESLFQKIRKGDRTALSKGLTLVESRRAEDLDRAATLIEKCLPYSGQSIRLGITGSPGVGKSTFIESLGGWLIVNGYRPAVLAVDPSSSISKGSLLGDKTRMEQLSKHKDSFIRPSPASDTLGGVAQSTRESIILCEAAGYDVIMVETVGVGQSETLVREMVDFFLLLILPGAGDDLQGIKRGIVELAHLILINKSDGDRQQLAARTQRDFQKALHYMSAAENGWTTKVQLASGLTSAGLKDTWDTVLRYRDQAQSNNRWDEKRKEQNTFWLEYRFRQILERMVGEIPEIHTAFERQKELLSTGQQSLTGSLRHLSELLQNTLSVQE